MSEQLAHDHDFLWESSLATDCNARKTQQPQSRYADLSADPYYKNRDLWQDDPQSGHGTVNRGCRVLWRTVAGEPNNNENELLYALTIAGDVLREAEASR